MKKFAILLACGLALASCQSKKQDMAAAPQDAAAATDPAKMDAAKMDGANSEMAKPAMSGGKPDAAAPMPADATKYPVKTKDGYSFGGERSIPSSCKVPPEGKQKGVPLTQAVVEGWPKQFFADVAIMRAALAGVAYPQEVAYIQDCMDAKVLEQQVPGPMPEVATDAKAKS